MKTTSCVMPRRLFLFAAYDDSGVIGSSLLWYVSAISACGDIVFFGDCNYRPGELERLVKVADGRILFAAGEHHGEYDFGSYKRAWQWASSHFDTASYDYVYLLNDSVFGPLADIGGYFSRMEALGGAAFAMALNPRRRAHHLQSWFIGLDRKVFTTSWFNDFLLSVTGQESKINVCELYENGFTRLLDINGIHYGALFRLYGKSVYNASVRLFRKGFPFVKKSAFTRHNGSLGMRIRYILNHIPYDCRAAIVEDASRLYGTGYIASLLASNPLNVAVRYMSYLLAKVFPRRSA